MAKINSFDAYMKSLRDKADTRMGVLSKDDVLSYIPTGSIVLDKLSGIGGIPVQRITQIASEPGIGKSTTALSIAASCQRLGGTVLYLDFEQAMTPRYAMKMGCDMESGKFHIAQPVDIDAAWEMIEASSNLGANLIILDSLANMLPRIEDEDMKKLGGAIGFQARGLGVFFPRFKNLCRVKNLAGLVINQVRSKLEFGWGAGIQRSPAYSKELPGGWAPKFNTDLLYYLSLKKTEKEKGHSEDGAKADVYTGTEIQVTTWKNKVGIPFKRLNMFLQFGQGIDDMRSIADMGVSLDLIDLASNGFWSIPNRGEFPGVAMGGNILNGRGEETLPEILASSPQVVEYLRNKILALDLVSIDESEQDQIKMLVSDDPDAGKEGGLPVTQVIPPPAMVAPPIPKENSRKAKER